ncbi:MAG: efflux transporter outer membrane subunit [Chitinispirillaceae bacterium]|jgi:multidrug efflux system outer membrane protein
MSNPTFVAILMVLVCSCAVGPNYLRPATEVPRSWRIEEADARRDINLAWWEQFNDSVLNGLVAAGLRENLDIRIAAARVEEYYGRFLTTRGGIFPQVSADVQATRFRSSQNGPVPLSPFGKNPANEFQAYGSAGWEIDLWGKFRRATEAARADLLSTKEAEKSVVLSLVASIAGAYIDLRDLDLQLDISRRTAKSREETYALFQLQFDKGAISELELNQAKSELEQALSVIPYLEKNISQQEDALCVLLGRGPGPIARGKELDLLSLPVVPAGLPSELLDNRPDIRQAEYDLIAANARIGVAQASYFPKLSLTGLFGWASAALSNLLISPSLMWNYSASVAAPVFQGGSLYGQVRTAKAVRQEAVFNYQQTILTALRDVEDALIDGKKTKEQFDALQRQVDALRNAARVARLRFDNGYTSYIEVLDAQRSLFSAELTLAQIKGMMFQSLISLYKAMGGGWVVEAQKMAR